uniref:Nucleotide-diphospho-sugar transferase domain-containing protein n=1 Tax=viral metagenome TaxID=1070528 RepID=A0A6C0EEF1_9ZZZZ
MFNILVLQIEDRSDNNFLNENMQLNNEICNENNIQYKFLYKSQDNVPPYWGKVFEIDRIISDKSNSNIDYVFWIDSDAFFLHFHKNRLIDFLNKYSNYSMIITKDPPPWNMNFNAGVFIVKNDSYSREIFSYWKSLYNPNNWRMEGNKWKTDKPYAGDDYEQGAFVTNILSNNQYSAYIKTVPYYILNNNSCTENTNETIVTHLAGRIKDPIKIATCKNVLYNQNYGIIYFIICLFLLLLIVLLCYCYSKKMKKYIHKLYVFYKKNA